jgi:hypothetical protein
MKRRKRPNAGGKSLPKGAATINKASGRGPKSSSKSDRTSRKIGRPRQSLRKKDAAATMCERPEEIQDVFEYAAAEVPYLPVPNASTKKEFLKNASRVYLETHSSKNSRRGRPSEEAFALMVIEPLSDQLGRQPTRTEIIAALRTRHLSMNTSRKYAKLYDLTLRGLNRLTQAERQWLAKTMGSESLSPQWWRARPRRLLGETIRTIFRLPLEDLLRLRVESEARRVRVNEQLRQESPGW